MPADFGAVHHPFVPEVVIVIGLESACVNIGAAPESILFRLQRLIYQSGGNFGGWPIQSGYEQDAILGREPGIVGGGVEPVRHWSRQGEIQLD